MIMIINIRIKKISDQILLEAIYAYNHSEIREEWGLGKLGVKLGNYFLEPNKDGVIKTSVEVNALRPYIGIGFGRAIPTKHRFACNFDLGFSSSGEHRRSIWKVIMERHGSRSLTSTLRVQKPSRN